jgi:hypothetical protein
MDPALVGVTDAVDLQLDTVQSELLPQPGEHDDLFGIDVRSAVTERLDVELVNCR